MLLNEKQQRILEIIDGGNTTGEGIAGAIGSSMQMIRHYLDVLSEDGYLKVAKVYDNATREFQVVRAYLTDKGKVAIAKTPILGIEAPIGSADDVAQIIKALERIQPIVAQLPRDRAEVAEIYLEDLQTEMKNVFRRKPQRIKAYFLALAGTALPVVHQTEQADLFIESVRLLSEKFDIAVRLPENVS